MKQVNVKKLILPNIPYVFIALLATKVSEAVRLAPGSDASAKLLNIMTGLNTAFHSLVPSFHPIDLCVGVAAAIAIRLAVYIKGKNAKKFRKNLEYGSARWGTAEDIKPYVDPAFENNIILTQTERLTMNSRPKDPKTARNKNVLIVGGSGSGKTRFWLKPNLLQCTSKTYPTSFVVTDPKGDIVVSCGHALQKNGYLEQISSGSCTKEGLCDMVRCRAKGENYSYDFAASLQNTNEQSNLISERDLTAWKGAAERMLTNEIVLKVFSDYLARDDDFEVVLTSKGYTVMGFDCYRQDWNTVDFCHTPEDLLDSLLDAYENFRMMEITGGDRDLTEKEEAKLAKERDALTALCEKEAAKCSS